VSVSDEHQTAIHYITETKP